MISYFDILRELISTSALYFYVDRYTIIHNYTKGDN